MRSGFLRRDPAAPLSFDNTMEACLRSFRLMAVAAPFYAVYSLIRYANLSVTIDDRRAHSRRDDELRHQLAAVSGDLLRESRAAAAGSTAIRVTSPPSTGSTCRAIVIAIAAIVVKLMVPTAIGGILEIALQALFFYWFLVTTRLTLGADWAMAVVLLVVNWVPSFFLLIIVDRYIGVLAGT